MVKKGIVLGFCIIFILVFIYRGGIRGRENIEKDQFNLVLDTIKRGDVEGLKKLIQQGVPVDVADENGTTFIMLAVRMGNYDIVKVLAEEKVDVNAKDWLGDTAIGWAMDNNKLDMVKVLLKAGADPNGKGGWSQQTALFNAACLGKVEIFKDFLAVNPNLNMPGNNVKDSPLMCAARFSHKDIVELLLAREDVMVDFQNIDGRTALFESSSPEITRMLLKAGAKLEMRDGNGWTPLFYASYYRSASMVEELIKAGADVNAKDKINRTSLMAAVANGKIENVRVLLKASAKVNEIDNAGWTALLIAAQDGMKYGRDIIVEELLRAGADVNLKDSKGRTALLYAAAADAPKMVEDLIKAGAQLGVKDMDGYSALDYAKKANFKRVIEVLEKYGAKE